MALKTSPVAGTYFPPKCSVDGSPHYLVPVSMWHDTEHDALEAHTLAARVAELERLVVQQDNTIQEDTRALAVGCRYRTALARLVAETNLTAQQTAIIRAADLC